MSEVYYCIEDPHTWQLLTLHPGKFKSESDLRKSVGYEFIDDSGCSIRLDDCAIKTVPAKPPTPMSLNEATGHRKECLCVSCDINRKQGATP